MASEPEGAAAQVFNIAELAEKIALELPMQDILGLQRTNSFIDAVIKSSQALQQKIHLSPASNTSDNAQRIVPHLPKHIVPHLPKHIQFGQKTTRILLFPRHQRPAHAVLDIRRARDLDPCECWKNTLLMQPPIQKLVFDFMIDNCEHGYTTNSHKEMNKSAGITLGDPDKFAQKALARHGSCKLCRRRNGGYCYFEFAYKFAE